MKLKLNELSFLFLCVALVINVTAHPSRHTEAQIVLPQQQATYFELNTQLYRYSGIEKYKVEQGFYHFPKEIIDRYNDLQNQNHIGYYERYDLLTAMDIAETLNIIAGSCDSIPSIQGFDECKNLFYSIGVFESSEFSNKNISNSNFFQFTPIAIKELSNRNLRIDKHCWKTDYIAFLELYAKNYELQNTKEIHLCLNAWRHGTNSKNYKMRTLYSKAVYKRYKRCKNLYYSICANFKEHPEIMANSSFDKNKIKTTCV